MSMRGLSLKRQKGVPYTEIERGMNARLEQLKSDGTLAGEQGQAIYEAARTSDKKIASGSGSGNLQADSDTGGASPGRRNELDVSGKPEFRSSVLEQQEAPSNDSEYRDQVKAASQRTLRENAAAHNAQVIDAGGRKAVALDADALAVWHRAFGENGAPIGSGVAWRGMSLPKALANKAIALLRGLAGSARVDPDGAKTAAGYDRLAKSLQDARDPSGTVNLISRIINSKFSVQRVSWRCLSVHAPTLRP